MKRTMWVNVILVLGLILIWGCSSGKTQINVTDAQKTASQNVVTDMAALKNISQAPDDPAIIGDFFAVFQAAQTLLGAVTGAQTTALTTEAAATCAQVSGGTITYSDCSYGGIIVSGTIRYSGNNYDINLTFKVQGTYDMTFKGSLTITDTSISGTYTDDITYSTTGVQFEYKLNISYNSVTLNAGCPVGGSMDLNAALSQKGASASYSLTSEYGPNCGDVKVLK